MVSWILDKKVALELKQKWHRGQKHSGIIELWSRGGGLVKWPEDSALHNARTPKDFGRRNHGELLVPRFHQTAPQC